MRPIRTGDQSAALRVTALRQRRGQTGSGGARRDVYRADYAKRAAFPPSPPFLGVPRRFSARRMKKRILVVEDEEKLRRVIELHLASMGFDVDKAATAEEGLKIVDRADLVLTDFKLPNMDGLQLLGLIRRQNAQVPVVMMTAFGSVETAVESMKAGATDFPLKPFSLDHLMQVIP
jgi:CheY-like chemotaxis protein